MAAARVIDGKAIAAEVRRSVAAEVEQLKNEKGLTPGLAVVLVGEDPASQVYVRNKARQTTEAGMRSFEHRLPASTQRSGAAEPDRRPQPVEGRARHPGSASAAAADRHPQGDRSHRSGQGRRRLSSNQRRATVHGRALRSCRARRPDASSWQRLCSRSCADWRPS